jgi:hypothetical protein
MNRLRNRLIVVFAFATLLPLGLTLWITLNVVDLSLGLAPFSELDAVSRSLETTGKKLYDVSCEILRRDAMEHRVEPRHLKPNEAQAFWDSGAAEQFELLGEEGNRLDYFVRQGDEVLVYSRRMGVGMDRLTAQIAGAHQAMQKSQARNLRRGFNTTLVLMASALWLAALGTLMYVAHRISQPV